MMKLKTKVAIIGLGSLLLSLVFADIIVTRVKRPYPNHDLEVLIRSTRFKRNICTIVSLSLDMQSFLKRLELSCQVQDQTQFCQPSSFYYDMEACNKIKIFQESVEREAILVIVITILRMFPRQVMFLELIISSLALLAIYYSWRIISLLYEINLFSFVPLGCTSTQSYELCTYYGSFIYFHIVIVLNLCIQLIPTCETHGIRNNNIPPVVNGYRFNEAEFNYVPIGG